MQEGEILQGNLMRIEVIKAAQDYRYLLDRGYHQKSALDLITSRYGLTKEERMLLFRCIHSAADAAEIAGKAVRPYEIREKKIIIDGYNVLLTILSAIEGRTLYLCDDGFVRDLRSSKIKDFGSPLMVKAITLLKEELEELRPCKVSLILDKNVSWSSEHAKIISKAMEAEVILASRADTRVILSDGIIASSDYLVLKKVSKAYDLGGHIVLSKFPQRVDKTISEVLKGGNHS